MPQTYRIYFAFEWTLNYRPFIFQKILFKDCCNYGYCLFKWAAWNFHRSCKWADFVAVQIGHKIKEKELKPRFKMLGKSYTIGDFTFRRLSQTLHIYWILATRLSQILPILNLAGNGKCVKNWNLRDRGTGAQIFRGLVKSETHCRRPRRYKSEFSFIGNDRQPS